METGRFQTYQKNILSSVGKVIVGKDDVIRRVLIAFVCGGHVLLEDVPGTGKTMLLRAFAKAVGGDFKRIQFTPDLLPSDLTGINFFDQKKGEFVFRKGPLFSHFVLADEINRATPRTQSSLLEAMEERQISVDGTTYALEEPFMVLATENPLESYGVFPLPEAQLDRFFMRLSLGYMTRAQELSVLGRDDAKDIVASLETAVSADDTAYVKEHYRDVLVSPAAESYLMDLIEATRSESRFVSGVSTRGGIALYRASQAAAAFAGRDYVIPEDIRDMAPCVLAHRISAGITRREDVLKFIESLLAKVPVPTEAV